MANYSALDTIWVLLAAILVFFMQAGFAMVETGLTRAKNAANIIMKNLMDFALGTLVYWLIGFGLMFAGSSALIGGIDFFMNGFIGGEYMTGMSFPNWSYIIFQTVFCATSATIVSGAMAERTKFISYCIYSVMISAFIYPISGHWIWGGGWLSQLGFHDFAGSTAVHMVGGVAAFVGAAMLGPRIGKYDKNGKARAIPGHSLTLAALGVFILWMCWFGFNGGSTTAMSTDADLVAASMVMVNTNLAAAAAATVTMILTWVRYKKPDVSMTLNGALAGLVGITAGCDLVSPFGAAAIGIICGILVVFAVEFIERVLKVDDPVGAVAVHGVCGATGTLLTGLFSTSEGLLYGYGVHFLGVQALGVLSVMAWVACTCFVMFTVLRKTIGLRVTKTEELKGLDIHEHGLASSYADFMPFEMETPATDKPMPVTQPSGTYDGITKISIVFNESRFEALKEALNQIGITGMTVSKVMGCGVQKGSTKLYRGAPVDLNLLPKLRAEIVVAQVPVQTVIDTAKRVLYTGEIGDGKMFVYNVENVIKVRTGEEGVAALQDVE